MQATTAPGFFCFMAWPEAVMSVWNDMGPTPQWVWNIFIGFGSLVGLIVFFSVASYEMDRNPGLQAQPRDTSTRQMNRRGR